MIFLNSSLFEELSTESETDKVDSKESLELKDKEEEAVSNDDDEKKLSLEQEKDETSDSTTKETQNDPHHNKKGVKVSRKTIRTLIKASRKI